jgi:hypothetical protein
MKKYIFIIFLLSATFSFAQEKYFYASLDVNKPLSNTSWIGDVSSSGVRAGYHIFLNPRLSAGLDIGWATFDQYNPTETTQHATGAITTDYFKYIYTYSATASLRYYFPLGEAERFFPYAGLGLGANTNEYIIYYNIYQDAARGWGFLARPEAGILVRLGSRRSLGLMAAVHADYSTNKNEKFGYKNFSTLGFQIGIILLEF